MSSWIRAGLLACLASCSILGGEAPTIRYFVIEPEPAEVAIAEAAAVTLPALRLRKVDTALRIGERLVWGDGRNERGFYEYARWVDSPQSSLDRLLRTQLFVEHGLQRTEALQSAALDVFLVAFEEDRATGEAQVDLDVHLTDVDGHSLLDRRVRVRRPIEQGETPDPAPIAEALSLALRDACAEIGTAAHEALAAAAASETPADEPQESSD